MNIPVLDRRLTVQIQTQKRGPDGSENTVWVDQLVDIPCQKEDFKETRRGEYYAANQQIDVGFTGFTIRWRRLTGAERIVHDGVVFNIIGVPVELGRRQFTAILAERGSMKH